jgi:hypothetical protein
VADKTYPHKRLLRLRKDYTHFNGIERCEFSVVFIVDGVERFRTLITIPSAYLDAFTSHSNSHWQLEHAAKVIGIPRYLLQTIIALMNRHAEWEIEDDGTPSELADCPYLGNELAHENGRHEAAPSPACLLCR